MKKCIGVLKLFLFLTVFSCFAVYGVQQIYALEHTKTKTFQITNLGTDAKIMFHYVNDATKLDIKTETFSVTTGNSTKKVLSNGWGTVTISISGSTATISYDKVSCEYKTPYIMVKAGTKNGYMPLPGQAGWKFGTVGSTGMSDNWNPNPPIEDGWANGECDLYTGVSFAYNSLEVVWAPVSTTVQYHKNDGGTSTASQTFTYGVAKQQFGKKTDGSPLWGTEKEDGFGGWDRPGYHILGWSESSTATKATYGTYSEVADSWIASKYPTVDLYAVWEPNQYNLTLDYNGATTIPSSTTVYTNYLTFDKKIANIYDSSRIAKTGYTFDGWYCGDVKLWNADGTPVKGAKVNGSAWSDSNGNYKWIGNTGVKAKWIPINYSISYDLQGGSFANGYDNTYVNANGYAYWRNPTSMSCRDSNINKPTGLIAAHGDNNYFDVENPTRTGYIFAGWKITGMDSSEHIYWNNGEQKTTVTSSNTKTDWGNAHFFRQLRATSGTVKFTAIWEPINYSITYDLQGGSFTNGYNNTYIHSNGYAYWRNPTSMSCRDSDKNKPTGLTAANGDNNYFDVENPTRTGYTFAGWKISGMDSSEHIYWNDGEQKTTVTSANTKTDWGNAHFFKQLRATSGTVKFTAIWSPNVYNIQFKGNGGTVRNSFTQYRTTISEGSTSYYLETEDPIQYPGVCYYDKSYVLCENHFENPGYTFVGWNTKADGTGKSYGQGETISNLTTERGAIVVLYAIWERNEYTVYLYPNKPTNPASINEVTVLKSTYNGWSWNDTGKCFEKTFYYDDTMLGVTPSEMFYLEGYSLSGSWYSSYSLNGQGAGTAYASTQKNLTTVSNGVVKLYAAWTDNIPTVGMTVSNNCSTQQTFSLTAGDTGSGIASYYFGTSAPVASSIYTSVSCKADGSYSMNKTVSSSGTYFFSVKDKNGKVATTSCTLYKVTWNAAGGTSSLPYTLVKKGNPIICPTATKEGNTFLGWYTEFANNAGDEITNSTICNDNMTAYAHWKINAHTLTFVGNGGSTPEPITKNYGSSWGTLPASTREGYLFLGWYTSAEGGTQITADTICKGDITAYAHWQESLEENTIVWTTSLSKMGGQTCFGVDPDTYEGISSVKTAIKNVFRIKKNVVPTNFVGDKSEPIIFYQYGDNKLYIYTTVNDGDFDTFSYDFCEELNNIGIADYTEGYTNASEKSNYRTMELPFSQMEFGKTYTVRVTGTKGTVTSVQEVYFRYEKLDLSRIKYVITRP